MRIAHLLRKYNPSEWGGTESVIHQLFDGLRHESVESVVYCPAIGPNGNGANGHTPTRDPLADAGCVVRRFRACVPVWGISPEQRRNMIAVGGNLMSFDLIHSLWTAPDLSLIHSHALGRVGGIGLTIARRRNIPFVVTVHGGLYDLPPGLKQTLNRPSGRGIEWGKPFGFLLRARYVIDEADAIFTCNPREAELIRERHPDRRVIVQPHGVRANLYDTDHRAAAIAAFPAVAGRELLLCLGRIDAVKNQRWLVEQMPQVLREHPRAILALVGACTEEGYGTALQQRIAELGLENHVLLCGKLPPADPRLIGLMQQARVALLPSVSETFGLVILEAWAAGTPAVSSRTSGASALIRDGETGWLFDLERPESFHRGLAVALRDEAARRRVLAQARERVLAHYDARVIAAQVKSIYAELQEEHHALGHPA